jgi:iron uptake system EfeUOB component EfeO/EfeM
MLLDLAANIKGAEKIVREAYQLQEEDIMHGEFLIDFNIMPRDILELFPADQLVLLCEAKEIKTRGNIVDNILAAYKDTEDLLVENYEAIGFRDINSLKENGINLSEAELGTTFEDVTNVNCHRKVNSFANES